MKNHPETVGEDLNPTISCLCFFHQKDVELEVELFSESPFSNRQSLEMIFNET